MPNTFEGVVTYLKVSASGKPRANFALTDGDVKFLIAFQDVTGFDLIESYCDSGKKKITAKVELDA